MMNRILMLLLLLSCFAQGCKKKTEKPAGSMTMTVNNAQTWTTTDVATTLDAISSILTVKCRNSALHETVTFTLPQYRVGRKNYYIGSGSVSGYTYGAEAVYEHGGYVTEATTGQISVSGQSTKTIDATFDVRKDSIRIIGELHAPIP